MNDFTARDPNDEDLPIGIRAKRPRSPFTIISDWVGLSSASPTGKALFWMLSMHVNTSRGDNLVWPSRKSLAALLGFEKEKSVGRYINELVELGAIEVEHQRDSKGMRTRNVYLVVDDPPDAYTGPRTKHEWYQRHNQENPAPVDNLKTPGSAVGPSEGLPPVDNCKTPGQPVGPCGGLRRPQMDSPVGPIWGPEVEEVFELKERSKPQPACALAGAHTREARGGETQEEGEEILTTPTQPTPKPETPTPRLEPSSAAYQVFGQLPEVQQPISNQLRREIVDMIQTKLHGGWAAAALVDVLSKDTYSAKTGGIFKHRLRELSDVPDVPRSAGSVPRHRGPDPRSNPQEMCRTHRGQWAETCGPCRSELLAAPDEDGPVLTYVRRPRSVLPEGRLAGAGADAA